MATMSFADMLRESGAQVTDYSVNENLEKLLSQHGLDYNGLVDAWKKNYGKNADDSLVRRGVGNFLGRYSEQIPEGGIDASPEQIDDMLGGWEFYPAQYLHLFKNLTPENISKVERWTQAYKLTESQKRGLAELFKKPEFAKAAIAKCADSQQNPNWHVPLSLMPDLSREDAEYLAANVPRDVFDRTVQYGSNFMPLELNKTFLRMRVNEGRLTTFEDNENLFRAAEQMMVSPNERPEARDNAALSMIRNSTDYYKKDKIQKSLDAIARIPAEDMKRYLDELKMTQPADLANRLNEGTFSPEQNAVIDDWSKKSNNATITRFIDGNRANELPPDQLEHVLRGWMQSIDATRGHSSHENWAKRDKFITALGTLPKETIDQMMEERQQNQQNRQWNYSNKFLGMWKYLNPRGESPSNEQFQSDIESDETFAPDKFDLDYKMRLEGAKTSIVTPEDLLKLVPQTSEDDQLAMRFLTHPSLTKDVFHQMANSYQGYGDFEYPFDGVGHFKNATSRSPSIFDGTHGRKTDVRVGSTALRQLRDHLDQKATEGVASLRPEELPKGRTFNTLTRAVTDKKGNVQHVLDWNPLRDNRSGGNLTSEKVREAIDAMPVRSIVVRNTKPWTGLQNHTKDGTSVMQFMPSAEAMQKIKDAGLWTAFGEMSRHHMEEGTSHPTAPFHLGWIRFSAHPDNEEVFIDEIQSDLHTSFRQLMKEPDNKLKDQMQSVMDILFGKHHPSEVMHEAFHQNLRDSGMIGHKVHIHGVKSKAHMSLQEPDRPVPAHFKEGYDAIPKKMSYTPAKYGDLSVETGDGDPKARKLKGMDTHGTKVVKFEEMLFELSKGEW
jgi:hypothetical protein